MGERMFLDATRGLRIGVPISKVNDELREIWGIATTPSVDIQGEIVDYEASKRAFQEWSDQFSKISGGASLGNIREMHKPNPVGRMVSWKADDANQRIWVGVRLSKSPEGDSAWTKVKEHVLNGFSIGAPTAERRTEYVAGRPVTRIVGYKLSELSLVDNPACQDAWITEIKLAKGAGIVGPIEAASDAPSGMDVVKENAYVDPDGGVWKRVGGGTFKRENAMEKTTIGAQHHEVASPPGPKTPTVQADPEKDKDNLPKKADGGEGIETPSKIIPGGPHDQASKPISPPETQGKAADAFGAPMNPAAPPSPMAPPSFPPAGGGHKYCSYCAGKLADGSMPFHQECQAGGGMPPRPPMAPAPAPMAPPPVAPQPPSPFQREAMSELTGGLQKAFVDGVGAFQKGVEAGFQKFSDNLSALAGRVEKIEKTPIPGGPARTELPGGVSAVDKGGTSPEVSKFNDADAAFEKTLSMVQDPFLRDKLSMERTRLGIMKAQAGR